MTNDENKLEGRGKGKPDRGVEELTSHSCLFLASYEAGS